MSNEIEVSNTALVVIFIGTIVGIILSIVLYKRKTLNERFIEKCRKEGCTAWAEVVRKRTFYDDAGYHPANKDSKFFLTWEYTVNGKTYRKKHLNRLLETGADTITTERFTTAKTIQGKLDLQKEKIRYSDVSQELYFWL